MTASTDLSCLDDNVVDELCMTSNQTWTGQWNFTDSSGMCLNDKPIYVSDSAHLLHFESIATSADAEVMGVWILSKGDISSNFLAICARIDIVDCSAGDWQVTKIHEDDDLAVNDSNSLQTTTDQGMFVQRGHCENDDDDGKSDIDAFGAFVISAFSALGCLFFYCMCCVDYRRYGNGERCLGILWSGLQESIQAQHASVRALKVLEESDSADSGNPTV